MFTESRVTSELCSSHESQVNKGNRSECLHEERLVPQRTIRSKAIYSYWGNPCERGKKSKGGTTRRFSRRSKGVYIIYFSQR